MKWEGKVSFPLSSPVGSGATVRRGRTPLHAPRRRGCHQEPVTSPLSCRNLSNQGIGRGRSGQQKQEDRARPVRAGSMRTESPPARKSTRPSSRDRVDGAKCSDEDGDSAEGALHYLM